MSKIAEYKKQHPEYRNIPDLELADRLYQVAYKGKMSETDFYELAFPEIAAKRGTDDIMFPEDEFNEKDLEKNRLKTKGIEVGHIFYFGDKYSKPMEAAVDLPGGKKDYVKMGSYGIGVSRLVGAIIEAKYDEKNEIMKWPISVAPYDIAIIPMINRNDTSALDKANKISLELNQNNIDAIIDDTDENLSSKIKKMNLIGAPYQIIIGKQTEGDLFEFKEINKETQKINLKEIIKIINKQKAHN